jgi:hypothetical protein
LFVNTTERRGLARFGLKWGWIRDMSNLAYSKHKGVGDFFGKWGGCRFGGMYWHVCDIGGVSGVVGWPNLDTNSFLISCRDFKLGVGDKSIESVVPPDQEPGVVDKLEG